MAFLSGRGPRAARPSSAPAGPRAARGSASEAYQHPLFKAHRLRRAEEFAAVFAEGSTRSGIYFRIHFRPNNLAQGRLGLVVPKRAEPRATRRNYVKRLIRELVRRRMRDIHGFDLVVRLQKAILREDAASARADLERLLGEVRR